MLICVTFEIDDTDTRVDPESHTGLTVYGFEQLHTILAEIGATDIVVEQG